MVWKRKVEDSIWNLMFFTFSFYYFRAKSWSLNITSKIPDFSYFFDFFPLPKKVLPCQHLFSVLANRTKRSKMYSIGNLLFFKNDTEPYISKEPVLASIAQSAFQVSLKYILPMWYKKWNLCLCCTSFFSTRPRVVEILGKNYWNCTYTGTEHLDKVLIANMNYRCLLITCNSDDVIGAWPPRRCQNDVTKEMARQNN